MSNVINITERLQEKRIQDHLQQINKQEQEWMRTLGYYVHQVFAQGCPHRRRCGVNCADERQLIFT